VRNVRDDIAGEVVLRAGEKSVVYKDRPPTPAEPVPPEEMVEVAAETSATLPPPTERAEGRTRPPAPPTPAVPATEAAGTPRFAVLTVTDDTFEKEVLQSGLPVLVDFWAAWAAPSMRLAPTVESVAQQYGGKLLVARVNVEENPESARRCRIQAVPTVVLFKDGNEIGRVAGAVSRPSIDTLLQNNGIEAQ
jgi:thioredoxin 1